MLGCTVQERQGVLGESQERTTKWIRELEHLSNEQRLRETSLCSLEKKWLRGNLINAYKYLKDGIKRTGQTLFSHVQRQNKGQWAQTRTQEAPSEYEEKHLYCGSDRSLEQAPEGLQSLSLEIFKTHLDISCAISSGWICLSGGGGLDFQSPFPPQPFCDSMK